MKLNYLLLATILCASCNGSTSQSNNSCDSIPAEVDSIAQNIATPTTDNQEEFSSYYLSLFELKGHVKSCVSTENNFSTTYNFDKDGKLTSVFDDGTKDYEISDGPDGEIIISSEYNVTTTYRTCDTGLAEEGRYHLIVWGTDGGESFNLEYVYDDNDVLTQINSSITSEDDEEPSVFQNPIKILETDAHSNWTKRQEGDEIVTRKIEYYK